MIAIGYILNCTSQSVQKKTMIFHYGLHIGLVYIPHAVATIDCPGVKKFKGRMKIS